MRRLSYSKNFLLKVGKRFPEGIESSLAEKSQIQSGAVADEVSVFYPGEEEDSLHNKRSGSASRASRGWDESDSDAPEAPVDLAGESVRAIQTLVRHRLRSTPKSSANRNDVQLCSQTGSSNSDSYFFGNLHSEPNMSVAVSGDGERFKTDAFLTSRQGLVRGNHSQYLFFDCDAKKVIEDFRFQNREIIEEDLL